MRWRRSRRRESPPFILAYGAWRSYADTVEGSATVVETQDGGQVYEVSWVKSEAAALEYLRRRDVRQRSHYVIVETPHRSFGRDLIMIFDEADGSLIEIPERTPLPEPTPSTTQCARCGYAIMPSERVEFPCEGPDCGHPWHTADFAYGADEVIRQGLGYRCIRCRSGACRACYEATGSENRRTTSGFVFDEGDEQPHPSDEIVHRLCWVCQGPVTIFEA